MLVWVMEWQIAEDHRTLYVGDRVVWNLSIPDDASVHWIAEIIGQTEVSAITHRMHDETAAYTVHNGQIMGLRSISVNPSSSPGSGSAVPGSGAVRHVYSSVDRVPDSDQSGDVIGFLADLRE
jgi:hypothetical protein